jgi:hypothetical protein
MDIPAAQRSPARLRCQRGLQPAPANMQAAKSELPATRNISDNAYDLPRSELPGLLSASGNLPMTVILSIAFWQPHWPPSLVIGTRDAKKSCRFRGGSFQPSWLNSTTYEMWELLSSCRRAASERRSGDDEADGDDRDEEQAGAVPVGHPPKMKLPPEHPT